MSDQTPPQEGAKDSPAPGAYEPPLVEDIETEDGPAFAAPLVVSSIAPK